MSARTTIEVLYRGGIAVDVPWQPLLEGDVSKNLHVLKSFYQNGQFQMVLEGRPDLEYEVRFWTPWRVMSATSAKSITRDGEWSTLRVVAPEPLAGHHDKAGYVRWTIAAAVQPF